MSKILLIKKQQVIIRLLKKQLKGKTILLILLSVFAVLSYGQQTSTLMSSAVSHAAPIVVQQNSASPMTLLIPLKNGHIFYEETREVNASKDDIFHNARKWFVNNFPKEKSVLQMEDKEDGIMMGKAQYLYSFSSGVKSVYVTMYFTLNLEIKDGKYRIQIYDLFGHEAKRDHLLDGMSVLDATLDKDGVMQYDPYNALTTKNIDFAAIYSNYLHGKSKKYNTKLLSRMDKEIQSLLSTLNQATQLPRENF